MAALIGLAELAPPPAEARNVAEAILQTLLRKQQLTTTELAKESGYRQETVARTLVHLRKSGLVLSAKAGRHMQNSLTATGRRRALALGRDSQVGEGPAPTEHMTLRRPPSTDLADCGQVLHRAELLATGSEAVS